MGMELLRTSLIRTILMTFVFVGEGCSFPVGTMTKNTQHQTVPTGCFMSIHFAVVNCGILTHTDHGTLLQERAMALALCCALFHKSTTRRATCVIATIARRIGQGSFIPLLMKFKELPPTLLQTLVLSVLIENNNLSTRTCTPLCGDHTFVSTSCQQKKRKAGKDREHRTQQSHVQIIVEWIPSSSVSPLVWVRTSI